MNHTYFSVCTSIRIIVLYSLSAIALAPVLGITVQYVGTYIWPQDILYFTNLPDNWLTHPECINAAVLILHLCKIQHFCPLETKSSCIYFLSAGLTDYHKSRLCCSRCTGFHKLHKTGYCIRFAELMF